MIFLNISIINGCFKEATKNQSFAETLMKGAWIVCVKMFRVVLSFLIFFSSWFFFKKLAISRTNNMSGGPC